MSIEAIRLKKGTVYKAIFCKNRKRVSRCFERKIDAKKWIDEQEMLQRYGCTTNITFREAAQRWLEHHSKVRKAPSSHRGDVQIINKSIIPFLGDLDLDQVSSERVEAYIAHLRSREIVNATVNRRLTVLRAILNYYVKRRHILFNPVSHVGLLPVNDTAYDYLSFEEADCFLTHAHKKYEKENHWVYLLYLLAMNTGMRWGEIAALKWDRVGLQQKRITVSRSYCSTSKQIRETTKGRKIRYVGINSSLLPELRTQYEVGRHVDNLVFSSNGRVIDLQNFKRDRFNKDLKEAGLRQIRFHDLRHTFASHFMMKNGNLYDLQKILGHSSITTTERYAHLSPNFLDSKTELVAIDGGRNVIPLQERFIQNG